MIDRYQLTKEILALVDDKPLVNVDIAYIIESHSVNMEVEEQKKLRVTIMDILRELRKMGDVEFHDGSFNITVSTGGVFWSNSGMVRSTLKRQNEIETKKEKGEQPTYQATFHAPFAGNFNQGDSSDLTQSVNEDSTETKELTKKQFEDFPKNVWYRRQGFIWLIIGILLATIFAILQLCNSK